MNIEQAEKVLTLQLEWVKVADRKVPPLFAINIGMLGVLSGLITSYNSWDMWSILLSVFSVAILGLSIVFLALVVFPRIDGPTGSYIFFGGISEMTIYDYISNFKQLDENKLVEDFLSQAHRNAEIVKQKYKYIRYAFICTFNGLPFWLITICYIYK